MIIAISVVSVLAGLFLIAAVAFAVLYFREKEKTTGGERYADGVKVIGGVRYSKDAAIFEDGRGNITLRQGDFVLEQGKTYTAQKGGALLAGTYTVLAASGEDSPIKLRVGGLVRDFRHGDSLVLADGESVCAVSRTAILR